MTTFHKPRLLLPAIDFIDPRVLATCIGEAARPATYRWMEEKAVPFVGDDKKTYHTSQALTDDDKAYLSKTWRNLPPLRRALSGRRNLGLIISVEEFRPYIEAFEQAPDRPYWRLHVRQHVGVDHQFAVQQQHEQRLRREIEEGTLPALTKHLVPSTVWLEVSLILMDDAVKYAARWGLDVSVSDESESEGAPSSGPAHDSEPSPVSAWVLMGATKRERQIQAIVAAARAAGYDPLKIPTGGKSVLRKACKEAHGELFGAGDTPFDGAWKEAGPTRLCMAERHRFAGSR
jgi:hypothetical protein